MNSSGKYRIRPLTISDLSDLADYEPLIELWQRSGLSHRPEGRDSRDEIAREVKRKESCFLGMFDGDRLIGSVIGTSDGRKGWINRLAVDPDYRGQGLGLRLIKECESFLFGLGLKIIAALIETDNKPSRALFAKAGYVFPDDIVYCSKRRSPEV